MPGSYRTQFVALDTSVDHTYEFLLKNGQVSYRIDNRAWTGAAWTGGYGYKLLVVGDGSAPTATGSGTMVVSAISFDNAPIDDVLAGAVPEPATWAMMIAGFGMLGGAARRRRSVSFA